MPGQPKFTRTVSVAVTVDPGDIVVNPVITWNPSGDPVEFEAKDWNRGFELGDLSEWTPSDAEISEADPYAGDYCCNLTVDDAYILQTLDEPMPMNAVYEFSAWVKRPNGVSHFILRMHHTDGTTNDVAGSLVRAGWQRMYFERSWMRADKILSAISVRSYEGQVFVDNVFLGLAGEIVTGAVDVSQGVPRALQGEMIARPMGFEMDGYPKKGSVLTGADWAMVVEYLVPENYKYMLSKILVSCPEDVMYRIRWGGTVKSAEVYVTGGIPFTDWFPWGYIKMWGDGVKKIDIQVKYPAGGAAATCHAELIGEYVPKAFNI